MTSGVRASAEQLAQAAANFDGNAGILHNMVAHLAGLVEEAQGAWKGEASSTYQDVQEQLNDVQLRLAATLADISQNLNDAGSSYSQQDEASGQNLAMNFGDEPGDPKPAGDKTDTAKGTDAAQEVDLKEKIGPLKDAPLDGNDPDRPGDPSRGRGDQGTNPSEPHGDADYRIGAPQRPDIKHDDDFKYNTKESNLHDEVSWAKWGAEDEAASVLRPDLDDATRLYEHYRDNSGTTTTFDYEKAYRDDSSVKANVDDKIAEAQRAAEKLVREGNTSFSMTGDATLMGRYPSTEDWQKSIGGYQQWASGDVHVDGNKVTMEVTVHAEDRYNFNRGSADIASGAPDNENGRFAEIGWAQPFDDHGEVKRTVTWTLGDAPGAVSVSGSGPERTRDPENEPNQPR